MEWYKMFSNFISYKILIYEVFKRQMKFSSMKYNQLLNEKNPKSNLNLIISM